MQVNIIKTNWQTYVFVIYAISNKNKFCQDELLSCIYGISLSCFLLKQLAFIV